MQSGDKLPSVDLYENTPTAKVNIAELTTGKKVIIIGVPGAFTPCCSKVPIYCLVQIKLILFMTFTLYFFFTLPDSSAKLYF
jgi:peroxiredoxin